MMYHSTHSLDDKSPSESFSTTPGQPGGESIKKPGQEPGVPFQLIKTLTSQRQAPLYSAPCLKKTKTVFFSYRNFKIPEDADTSLRTLYQE